MINFTPPPDGRIHIVQVKVMQDRPWKEAVNAGSKISIPASDPIFEIGDLYLPVGVGEIDQWIILLNYPNGNGTWQKALAWAEDLNLEKTVPREIFAISEHHPDLHASLHMDPVNIASTTECMFMKIKQTCCVGWGNIGCGAYLDRISRFGRYEDWFAFHPKSQ